MKLTEFRKLIKEEIHKVIKEEDNLDSAPDKIVIKDAAGRSVGPAIASLHHKRKAWAHSLLMYRSLLKSL